VRPPLVGNEVDVTQFDATISQRIQDARKALDEARGDGDDYLADIRLGELESLARVAAEHGILVEGVAETLAGYGLSTPAAGVTRVVDVRAVEARETPA
jgi:putative N-acetylmannosamine-6-phosphate epimerase